MEEWGGLAEIYCLSLLEAGSLKSKCQHGWFPLRAVKEGSLRASLLTPDSSFCLWQYNPNLYIALCVCVYVYACVCVCPIFPFYKDTIHSGLASILMSSL